MQKTLPARSRLPSFEDTKIIPQKRKGKAHDSVSNRVRTCAIVGKVVTVACAGKQMDEFMERLADLILLDMERRHCSATYFADVCGISKNEIVNITNRKKKDIYVSTLLKICEGSGISANDVLGLEESFNSEKVAMEIVLEIGRNKYRLKKI